MEICENKDNNINCQGIIKGLGCYLKRKHICRVCYYYIKYSERKLKQKKKP